MLKKSIKGKYSKINVGDNCSFRKTRIRIRGVNNCVVIDDDCVLDRVDINIEADNAFLRIRKGAKIKKTDISILDGKSIEIGADCEISDSSILNQKGDTITIGDNCLLAGHKLACQGLLDKHTVSITVGKDCMFGVDSKILTTDSHPVFDFKTKERTNKDKSVIINNHVWLTRDVTVTKGVEICEDVIIGLGSHVHKSIKESHCAYAGSPLKVIKKNVTWN